MEPNSTIRPLVVGFCYLALLGFAYFSNTVSSLGTQSYTCNGSIAECNPEDEILMASEISRRFLEQKRYISPGALRRDKPVCNDANRGEAYSKSGDCLPPPSNPQTRGCSKYYRCRSDSWLPEASILHIKIYMILLIKHGSCKFSGSYLLSLWELSNINDLNILNGPCHFLNYSKNQRFHLCNCLRLTTKITHNFFHKICL